MARNTNITCACMLTHTCTCHTFLYELVFTCCVATPLLCRGPSIVIGYLMKLRNWRLAEAYKWVKDKRPSVNISQGAGCMHGMW